MMTSRDNKAGTMRATNSCSGVLHLIVLSLSLCPEISCVIIGAFVVPHGGIALDPSQFNTTNTTAKQEAWSIHRNYKSVGQDIHALKPDIVFLSTPHGVADEERFVVYLNSVGEGGADTDNVHCPPACFNVTAKFAYDIAAEIVNTFKRKVNISGLSAFGPPGNSDEAFPLR